MQLTTHNTEIEHMTRLAAALLGEPALPLELSPNVERAMRQLVRNPAAEGAALPCLLSERGGCRALGAVEFDFAIPGEADLRLVRIERRLNRVAEYRATDFRTTDFWAAGASDYRRFHSVVGRLARTPFATQDDPDQKFADQKFAEQSDAECCLLCL